ncbi:MAG: hypothetical protein V1244_01265 [Nitrospinaceae bacterium]|jgi:hypothetical protein|nr:hypothetical protein [Nitrospinaceae bacterium]
MTFITSGKVIIKKETGKAVGRGKTKASAKASARIRNVKSKDRKKIF